MKLGLFSDVHGNRIALEAVLADGRSQDAEAWWALGDLVAIGPDPVPTLELLASVPNLHVTRGNTDRYVANGDRPPPYPQEVAAKPELLGLFATVEGSFAWTRGALASHGRLDWLAELPLERRTTLPDGTRVLGVHASPGRDDGAGITPDRPEPELRAAIPAPNTWPPSSGGNTYRSRPARRVRGVAGTPEPSLERGARPGSQTWTMTRWLTVNETSTGIAPHTI